MDICAYDAAAAVGAVCGTITGVIHGLIGCMAGCKSPVSVNNHTTVTNMFGTVSYYDPNWIWNTHNGFW